MKINLLTGASASAKIGRAILLEILAGHLITRTHLQKKLQLSPASVSNYVGGLIEAGLLLENPAEGSEQARASRGRPEIPLSIHPRAFCAVGLDFGAGHLRGALCQADMSPIAFYEIEREWKNADQALAEGRKMLKRFQREAPDGVPMLGQGIADPGMVDARTGESFGAVHVPQWKGIFLKNLPPPDGRDKITVVRPAAFMKCQAECLLGNLKGIRDGAFIDLGMGIGAAIIAGGNILEGTRGLAGEFGHICVQPHGKQCACGASGCLETESSGFAIMEAAKKLAAQNRIPHDSALYGRKSFEAEGIAKAAMGGDTFARQLFAHAGEFLGYGLSSLVNLLNPQVLVLGGGLSSAGELLVEPVRKTMLIQSLMPARNQVEIRPSALANSQAGAIGAAATVILSFLRSEGPQSGC